MNFLKNKLEEKYNYLFQVREQYSSVVCPFHNLDLLRVDGRFDKRRLFGLDLGTEIAGSFLRTGSWSTTQHITTSCLLTVASTSINASLSEIKYSEFVSLYINLSQNIL